MSASRGVIAEKKIPPAVARDAVRDSDYSGTRRRFGKLSKRRFSRMIPGSLAFVFFTVGIFWHQFQRIQPGKDVPGWRDVRWEYLFLMLSFAFHWKPLQGASEFGSQAASFNPD